MLNLSDAIVTLNKVADILESLNIEYWIDSGTLLSAYRDKSFNIFDHDIDIRVKKSVLSDDKLAEFIKAIWQNGFRDIEGNKPYNAQVLFAGELGIVIDFKLCEENDKYVWYYCWREPDPKPILHVFPNKFYKELGKINLCGRDYPCPNPPLEYIEHHYGEDWRMFKVRIEEANETDVSWDYMKDPPCAMTQGQFLSLTQDDPFKIF
jgi:hypothetical protein